MNNIIILADHNIGYYLTEFLLERQLIGEVKILSVYTNDIHNNIWWKKIEELKKSFQFDFHLFSNNSELFNDIMHFKIDYIFLFSWRSIVSNELLNLPLKGCVNLHYSLLPKYRGVYPVNWQIINGEEKSGVTFHYVDNKIDHGDIIIQEDVEIHSWETSYDLLTKLDFLALNLFKKIYTDNMENFKRRLLQDTSLMTIYSTKDFIESNQLNLDKSYKARDLINLIRGKTFKPYSKNLFYLDEKTGEKVFISLILEKET